MRTTSPLSTRPEHTGETVLRPAPAGTDAAQAAGPVAGGGATPRPANRAERRAARRGRSTATDTGPAAPRHAGPAPHAKPAHVRTDFAARRTG